MACVMSAGWSAEETKVLLGVWGAADVQGVSRNRTMHEKVAAAMADQGFNRSWQKCSTKVKNLMQRHRKV